MAESYAFKHAITRQVTYDLMPFAQRRQLHATVAHYLEERGGVLDHALLGHHWSEAGVAGKAFDYFVRAGEDAARADANPEAAHFFSRALTLDLTGTSPEEIELRRARCYRRLGEVSFALGALDKAHEAIQATFSLLAGGRHRQRGRLTTIAVETLVQVSHLVRPGRVEVRDPIRRRRDAERSKTAGLLALLLSTPLDTVGMLGATLQSLNAAERAGTVNVFGLGMLGYAAEALGLHRLAQAYFARARSKALELNELSEFYGLAVMFEGMARFGAADHARIITMLREDLQAARDIGDRRAVARLAALVGAVGGFTLSVDTDELLQWASEAIDANRRQPAVDQAYFLTLQGSLLSMFSRPSDARPLVAPIIERMNASLEQAPSDAAALACAMFALFHTRQGDLDAAENAANRAMAWLRRNIASVPPTGWVVFQGVVETYMARYRETVSTGKSTANLQRGAREALTLLRRYARRREVYRARWQYFEGVLASLDGRHDAAKRHWLAALSTAQRLSLPFDEGVARLELARVSPADQAEHLRRAREIFAAGKATYYLDQLSSSGA